METPNIIEGESTSYQGCRRFLSIRFQLLAISTISILTSIILMTMGILVPNTYAAYEDFLGNVFSVYPAFVTLTGVLILAISILGIYVAITQKYEFFGTYVSLRLTIFIFEIMIAYLGFNVYGSPNYRLNPSEYGASSYMNRLQTELQCCGANSVNDWGSKIPVSCCPPYALTYDDFMRPVCTSENAYYNGCMIILQMLVANGTLAIGIASAVVTGLHGIFLWVAASIVYRLKFCQEVPYKNMENLSVAHSPKGPISVESSQDYTITG